MRYVPLAQVLSGEKKLSECRFTIDVLQPTDFQTKMFERKDAAKKE